MQKRAFRSLLDKYSDFDTNPGNEPISKVEARLMQESIYYYVIYLDDEPAGAIAVVDDKLEGKRKRIAPLFILPEYQNRGIAQETIRQVEEIHGRSCWKLNTILEEAGNCHLYEKMGYHRTGCTETINETLTLVFYEKD